MVVSCSLWSPFLTFGKSLVENLPVFSGDTGVLSTSTASLMSVMGRMNHFVPVTEFLAFVTFYQAIIVALLSYKVTKRAIALRSPMGVCS